MTAEASPAPTVTCATCDGTTFTIDRCRCRDGDGSFLVGEVPSTGRTPDGLPWPDCQSCAGQGSVARPCQACAGQGRQRAQLVLTVANLETGAVASANVVPGSVEPTPGPAGGWRIALAPLLAELAGRAGTAPASLREVFDPDRPPDPDGQLSVPLGPNWRPGLAAAERYEIEGRALARRAYAPWLVFVGQGDPAGPPGLPGQLTPASPSGPDAGLDRLRRLADRLCLDLVVEARDTGSAAPTWEIRFEVPGSAVPAQPHAFHPDLPTAAALTSVADAWYDLAERGRTAPAHFLRIAPPDSGPAPPDSAQVPFEPVEPIDVDRLERRILRDCVDAPGAQALWRDGRWRHTRLRVADVTDRLVELETGQLACRRRVALTRNWEPPAPRWLGPPIPYADCPGCRGTGTRQRLLPCHTCAGGGRIHHGAVLTITDLADRVVHLNWRAGAAPVRVVGSEPAGQPVVQLPEGYRVGTWAATFGVRLDELHDPETGRGLDQDLVDGIVTVPRPDVSPVAAYLAAVGRGRPGARIVVSAAGRGLPPLPRLARLVCGLGLTFQITVADYRHDAGNPRLVQGLCWQVAAVAPETPLDPATLPLDRSLPEAIANFLRYLAVDLHRSLPATPACPIRVPQQPVPPAELPDPTRQLRDLAARHPGQPVTARLGRTGCQVHVPG